MHGVSHTESSLPLPSMVIRPTSLTMAHTHSLHHEKEKNHSVVHDIVDTKLSFAGAWGQGEHPALETGMYST